MNFSVTFCIILAIVICKPCGEYSTNCVDIKVKFGSGQYFSYISTNMNGFVKEIEVEKKYYAEKKCRGDASISYNYVYKLKKSENETDATNALYTGVMTKAHVRSDNVEDFAKELTCYPEMKNGKTYDIQDIRCEDALQLDRFAIYKKALNQENPVKIIFENTDVSFVGIVGMTSRLTKTGNFWGCWHVWSLVLTIILSIIAILIIVIVVFMLVNKKKSLPRKHKH